MQLCVCERARARESVRGPTVSVVNSGGLSLTSVILMTVVAVLDRP